MQKQKKKRENIKNGSKTDSKKIYKKKEVDSFYLFFGNIISFLLYCCSFKKKTKKYLIVRQLCIIAIRDQIAVYSQE